MKKQFTPRQLFFVLVLTATSIVSSAQHNLEFLNANNVNAGIGIGGNLFSLIPDRPQILPDTNVKFSLLEVPKNSNKRTIFTAALWMSGLDTIGNIYSAAQRFLQGGADFYNGPIVSIYDSLYDNFYKRVFKITRSQITHHQSLGNVIIPTQIDSTILFWPAKGNAYVANYYGVSINSPLAPFVDVNSNGIYDPNHGDYPDVCGEEAIFFVFNDVRGKHHETDSINKLGFEMRGLAEVFVDYGSANNFEKQAINNTVFVSYEIENKSQQSFHDFYLSMFEDPDLGCYYNDRVGCDTTRSLQFVYNGTTPDPDCNGVIGYNQINISQGIKMLTQQTNVVGYYSNSGGAQDEPSSSIEYRNHLQGFWNDGISYTYGGTGYGGTVPTKFIFPGDPNNPNDWSDVTSGLPPGDRRMFGSTGPTNFAQGEIKHFDFAFTTSYDSTATNLTIIDTLKRDADIVQQFYDNEIVGCRTTHQIPLSVNNISATQLSVLVYPNPSSTQIVIETKERMELLELIDIQGRLVVSKIPDSKKISVDVSLLAHGIYLLHIKSEGKFAVKKLVVE